METIEELVLQLGLFSSEVIDLEKPIDEERLSRFEIEFGFQLPIEYKTFLKLHNGLSLMGVTIYGISDGSQQFSLEQSYRIEHDEVDNPMPEYLIPFSPDGAGNHYCFDIRACDFASCKIVFWQHDMMCNDEPEVVNLSFADWIKEVVIDWTLEDYDYDGKSK